MRILHAIDYRWWNGSAYYGITMALGTARNGHDVLVAGRAGSPPIQKAQAWGLEVRTGIDLRGGRQWDPRRGILALRGLIREFGPHVVVAHDGDSHTLAGLAIGTSGRPTALVRGRADIRPPARHPLTRWLYRRRTDAFLLAGEFMLRRGDFRGIVPGEALHVVHPAIDVESFTAGIRQDGSREAFRSELRMPNDTPLVGIVARYDPIKGHDTFLEAARRIKILCPEARFLASGVEENVKIDSLLRMSRELEVADRSTFIGKRETSAEILPALDVGVIASKGSEAVCRILLEYMSAGIPVVATSVGVIPEVVDQGITGYLVPPGDDEAMARALGILLLERDLRERMGKAGRARVEALFGLKRMADRVDAIIAPLVRANRK